MSKYAIVETCYGRVGVIAVSRSKHKLEWMVNRMVLTERYAFRKWYDRILSFGRVDYGGYVKRSSVDGWCVVRVGLDSDGEKVSDWHHKDGSCKGLNDV